MINYKDISNMTKEEAIVKIEKLKREYKKEATTSKRSPHEVIQEYYDYNQHTERSFILAEAMLLTNEFLGIEGVAKLTNELVFISLNFLSEQYQENEKEIKSLRKEVKRCATTVIG